MDGSTFERRAERPARLGRGWLPLFAAGCGPVLAPEVIEASQAATSLPAAAKMSDGLATQTPRVAITLDDLGTPDFEVPERKIPALLWGLPLAVILSSRGIISSSSGERWAF